MIQEDGFNKCIDKDILRQEQFLKILIQEDTWYSLEEVATQLNWSKTTIRKDIDSLNDCLPSGWELKPSKGRGICLKKPAGSSLVDVIYIIRSKSKICKILECVLSGKYRSAYSLSKHLMYPYDAVKKILKNLDLHLKDYNLTLYKYPLSIEGCEFTLRAYLTRFYLNIYMQSWPFENYNQNSILTYITMIEKSLGIILYPWDKHKLSYFLVITLNRIKRRESLSILKEDSNLLEHTLFYEACKRIQPFIEKEHNVSLSSSDLTSLTIKLIGAKYQYINEQDAKNLIIKRIQEKQGFIYTSCYSFVKTIETELGISLLDDEDFLFQLVHCFRSGLYNSKIYLLKSILNSPIMVGNNSLANKIQNKYSSLFQLVKEQYQLLFKEYNYIVTDEEVTIITLLIEARRMMQSNHPIKVLLHIGENPGMYAYISSWLQKYFYGQLEVVRCTRQLTQNYVKSKECELIITNIELSVNMFIPIIKISEFPNERDKQAIQEFIVSHQDIPMLAT